MTKRFQLLVKCTHSAFGSVHFSCVVSYKVLRLSLVYQRKVTQIRLLCFGSFFQADFQSVVSCGLFESALDDCETSFSDGLDLTGDSTTNSGSRVIQRRIDIVVTRPNIVSQFHIAKSHLRSIFRSYAESFQHRRISGTVLHKLLGIDAHLLIQSLNPGIHFLCLVAETSTKSLGDAVPLDSFADSVLNKVDYGPQCGSHTTNNVNHAGHIQRCSVYLFA